MAPLAAVLPLLHVGLAAGFLAGLAIVLLPVAVRELRRRGWRVLSDLTSPVWTELPSAATLRRTAATRHCDSDAEPGMRKRLGSATERRNTTDRQAPRRPPGSRASDVAVR